MKKLIGLLVAGLTISILMAGCNKPAEGDNAGTTTGTTGKSATPEKAPTPPTTGATTGAAPTTGDTATTGGTATGGTPPTTTGK